jgi:hypothetical protein
MKRKRIIALVNAWSRIIRENITSREEATKILQMCYKEIGVEPIRGSSSSPDLYDKDMASLYIIAKWGLGLDKELSKDVLEKLFDVEIKIEKILEILKNVSNYDEFCSRDPELCKSVDDKLVARILRFLFTMYYFEFMDKQTFVQLMRKVYNVFKPMEETVRRFAKFVIAYEVGKKLADNEIKTKIDINIAKNTIAIDFGIPNILPSISYIIEVSKHFFEIPQNLVNSLKSRDK